MNYELRIMNYELLLFVLSPLFAVGFPLAGFPLSGSPLYRRGLGEAWGLGEAFYSIGINWMQSNWRLKLLLVLAAGSSTTKLSL